MNYPLLRRLSGIDELVRDFFDKDFLISNHQQGNKYVYDVPGFNKDNLDVKVDGQVIEIKGENKELGRKFYQKELLPRMINSEKMKAVLKDGVLIIEFEEGAIEGVKKIAIE